MYVSWKSKASFAPISFELQQNGNSSDSIFSFVKKTWATIPVTNRAYYCIEIKKEKKKRKIN